MRNMLYSITIYGKHLLGLFLLPDTTLLLPKGSNFNNRRTRISVVEGKKREKKFFRVGGGRRRVWLFYLMNIIYKLNNLS